MITIEYRESSSNWEEYKTYKNEEELRQDINSFLYNFMKETEEIYIYFWKDEEEKESRTKLKENKTKWT
jgi:hypothetical protein